LPQLLARARLPCSALVSSSSTFASGMLLPQRLPRLLQKMLALERACARQ
jgi:hypothetical protein